MLQRKLIFLKISPSPKSKVLALKLLIAITIYLLSNTVVIAQKDSSVFWGDTEELSSYNYDFNFVNKTKNALYTCRYNANRGNGLVLEKYDATTLKKLFIQSIDFEELAQDNEEQNFEKIIFCFQKLYVFSSVASKKEKKNLIYANIIDSTGKAIATNKLVCSTALHPGNKADLISIETSTDSTSFLISMRSPAEKEKNSFLQCFVISGELDVLFSKQLEIPYASENTEFLKTMLWNNQNIYFLLAIEDQTNRKSIGNRIPFPKTHLLLCYNYKVNKMTEILIAIQSKWIHSCELVAKNMAEAAIGGFYSNTADLAISGGYILKVNLENDQIADTRIYAISRDKLNEISQSEYAVMNKKLTYFKLDHFIPMQNNRYVLIGENRHVSSSANINPYNGVDNVTYTYYNGNIVCLEFDTVGDQVWFIPKDQKTINDYGEFSSYGIGSYQSHLGFIFNSMDVNYSRVVVDPYQNPLVKTNNMADLMFTEININSDTDIELKQIKLLDGDKNKWRVMPYKTFFSDEKHLYFYAQKGGKFTLGKMEISNK